MAAPHRHRFDVTRREPNTGHALIRVCTICGEVQRKHRGRWVVSISAGGRS